MKFGTIAFPGTCIIEDMPYDQYRAVDAIAWSTLREIGKSPERLKWVVENGKEDIESGPMGNAFHAAVLEPAKFATQFATYPARYPMLVSAADGWTCKAGEAGQYIVASGRGSKRVEYYASFMGVDMGWDVSAPEEVKSIVRVVEKPWNNNAGFCKDYGDALAAQGVTILSRDDHQTVRAMADRLLSRPDVQDMLAQAKIEVSMFWTDPQTGLNCKGRVDILWAGDQIGDPKMTAKSGDWEKWAGTVRAFGYAGQMGMYRDGLDVIRKALKQPSHDVRLFRWLVAEREPPYSTYLYEVQDVPGSISYDWIAYGRALWHGHLQRVKWCMDNNEWPGGNTEPDELAVPEWCRLDLKAAIPAPPAPDNSQAVADMEAEFDSWKGKQAPEGAFPRD